MQEKPVYELIGGAETIERLVDVFYAKVEADEALRDIFPEDLEPGKRWQYLFLMQLFGGPTDYSEERGRPRLRMRHAPFQIDVKARDSWLKYMLESIDEVGIQEPARSTMHRYFEKAATHMINTYTPTDE